MIRDHEPVVQPNVKGARFLVFMSMLLVIRGRRWQRLVAASPTPGFATNVLLVSLKTRTRFSSEHTQVVPMIARRRIQSVKREPDPGKGFSFRNPARKQKRDDRDHKLTIRQG